jgi:GDP-L-galactose phosphorylase
VNPAVWEISGHIVLKRREDYEAVTEDYAWKLLSEVSLTVERFTEVKRFCLEAACKESTSKDHHQVFSFIQSEEGWKLPEQSTSGKNKNAKSFASVSLQETVV